MIDGLGACPDLGGLKPRRAATDHNLCEHSAKVVHKYKNIQHLKLNLFTD